MNENLEKFKQEVYNKSVSVIGIGISNIPLIKMLVEYGACVIARDKKDAIELGNIVDELSSIGVKLILGENYLQNINEYMVFKSPGIRFDVPELLKAKENGSIITSEMEVFFDVCPAQIIAVTGSDGKTTTTSLIYKILDKQGYKCWLGGNIGNPLLSKTSQISVDDKVILELSSFQLHTMKKSPSIAVITNLSPNHLDMHKSMEEYIEAKENIFMYQSSADKLIINYDNEITNSFKNKSNANITMFSRLNKLNKGIYLYKDNIYFNDEKVVNINDIKLPGVHNIENYMAAIGAVWGLVSIDSINEVAKTFNGVEHRIELVRTLNGVKYYNSSIDSSPNRSKSTLSVFNQKVIMISGGKDKGIPYDEIGPVIAKHVKKLILIGKTSEKINEAVKNTGVNVDTVFCRSYEEVVKTAYECAKSGDIVVLSPASTSFDMFKNFEERGNLFKRLVMEL